MKRTRPPARDPEDLELGEAQARPPAATAAGVVLALQRSAGNHAVAAFLARDATKPAPKPKEGEAPQASGPHVIFPGIGVIPITSFTWGTRSPNALDKEEGDKLPKEILLTSEQGGHSAALLRAALDGKAVDAEVVWPSSGGAVLHVKLKNALVSSYQVSSGGGTPTESWALNFESAEIEIKGGAKDGGGDYEPGE